MGIVCSNPVFQSSNDAVEHDRPLDLDETLPLPQAETAAATTQHFEQVWKNEVQLHPSAPSMFRALLKGYRCLFTLGFLCRLCHEACNISVAFTLRYLVLWFAEADPAVWKGYFLSGLLGVLNFIGLSLFTLDQECTQKLFQKFRAALTVMIFQKTMKLDADQQLQGRIVQMHSTDTSKLKELYFIHGITSGPFAIVGYITALWVLLGPSALLSCVVLAVALPIQGKAGSQMGVKLESMQGAGDKRIKAINEVLQGIRICKFMGWENQFVDKIQALRQEEVGYFYWVAMFRSIIMAITYMIPSAMQVLVFGVAWATGTPMTPDRIFPALALMQTMRGTALGFALACGKFIELIVSLERIETFLLTPEKVPYLQVLKDASVVALPEEKNVFSDSDKNVTAPVPEVKDAAVILKNASFGYLETGSTAFVPLMSNVNLSFPRGSLTIIVGHTGGGKSTLLNGIIGEGREGGSGFVSCSGSSIAFVPQEPWIQSGTIRDNILLDQPYDEERYLQAVQSCQLLNDFAELTDQDMTEIGERGINISGGQKQRIAFARAVYSGREIVVMDDPLSAVDSHVGTALFESCIVGALQGRTRILVTHHVQYIPFADQVIALKACQIEFSGTPQQFFSSGLNTTELSPTTTPTNKLTPSVMTPNSGKLSSSSKLSNLMASSPPPASPMRQKLVVEEKQMSGGIGYQVYKWYFHLGGSWNTFLVFLFYSLNRASTVLTDMWLAFWTSKSPAFGQKEYSDKQYFTWFAVTTAAVFVTLVGREVEVPRFCTAASSRVHEQMITSILRAPVSFFDSTPVGRILNRFSKDVQGLDLVISDFLNFSLAMIYNALGSIVLMSFSAPYLILPFSILTYFYWRELVSFAAALRCLKRIENISLSPTMAIMSELMVGHQTVRTYQLESSFCDTHKFRLDRLMRTLYNMRMTKLTLLFRVVLMGSLVVLLTSMTMVIVKTVKGADVVAFDAGLMSLAVAYSLNLTISCGYIVQVVAELDSGMSSVERLKEYVDELPTEKQMEYGATQPDAEGHPPPPDGWPRQSDIEFHDVMLRYREGLPLVLKGITVHIKSGEKVGLVGRTGCGKSTIMLALFRIVELAGGYIRIDNVDIASLKLSDLRNSITIIPQDPLLFEGTVRSNIDPFGHHDDKVLWSVLEKVNVAIRVREDEHGLDGEVTERGSNFSVGQRQLMCLARALLKRHSKILLLDEATASVDFEADALIQQTIRTEFADYTVLTIAHRLATVIDNDRVVVLHDGCISECGSPHELLQRPHGEFFGLVANLGEEQFKELSAVAAQKAKKQ